MLQIEWNLGGKLPGGPRSPKITKNLGYVRWEARNGASNLSQIRSEATPGADESATGQLWAAQAKIEGRAAQTARGQTYGNRSQDLKRKDLGGVE